MDTVGIIGAGQMGAGVAQVAAASGYAVVLADRVHAAAPFRRCSMIAAVRRGR